MQGLFSLFLHVWKKVQCGISFLLSAHYIIEETRFPITGLRHKFLCLFYLLSFPFRTILTQMHRFRQAASWKPRFSLSLCIWLHVSSSIWWLRYAAGTIKNQTEFFTINEQSTQTASPPACVLRAFYFVFCHYLGGISRTKHHTLSRRLIVGETCSFLI